LNETKNCKESLINLSFSNLKQCLESYNYLSSCTTRTKPSDDWLKKIKFNLKTKFHIQLAFYLTTYQNQPSKKKNQITMKRLYSRRFRKFDDPFSNKQKLQIIIWKKKSKH